MNKFYYKGNVVSFPAPISASTPSASSARESASPFSAFWDFADSIATPPPLDSSRLPNSVVQEEGPSPSQAVFQRVMNGPLSDEDKQQILDNYGKLSTMKESEIVDLFVSQEVPKNANLLSQFVKEPKHVERVFLFAWQHQLVTTFGSFPLHPSFASLTPFILSQMNVSMSPAIVKMIQALVPYFKEELRNSLFTVLKNMTEEQRQRPDVIELGKEFFFHKATQKYLADETTPLVDLHTAFTFCFSHIKLLSEDQQRVFKDIAHQLFYREDLIVDAHVQAWLKRFPDALPKELHTVIDCLQMDTVDLLEQRIGHFIQQGEGLENLAKEFIEANKTISLSIWKHLQDEQTRKYTWVSKGTQIGKDGNFDYEEAIRIGMILNQRAPALIEFDLTRTGIALTGGVCTAMTMRFANLYLAEIKKGKSPLEALKTIAPLFKKASPEFRTIQSIYNTIKRASLPEDFKKSRIQALLGYELPGLPILQATEEVDLNLSQASEKLAIQLSQIPDGLFFVRAITPLLSKDEYFPDDRELLKGEEIGHSTFLIKEKGEAFYYDPAIGILQFNHPEKQLPSVLEWENQRWGVHRVRMYQIA